MATTANINRVFEKAEFAARQCSDNTTKIYNGVLLGLASGKARSLVAGDPFLGVAEEQITGHGLPWTVRFRRKGAMRLIIASAAATDIGKDVYASDEATFTYTQSTNTRIGSVIDYDPATLEVIVEISPIISDIAEMTIAAGTPADAVADNTGTFSQTITNNNIASVAAKINELIRRLGS